MSVRRGMWAFREWLDVMRPGQVSYCNASCQDELKFPRPPAWAVRKASAGWGGGEEEEGGDG